MLVPAGADAGRTERFSREDKLIRQQLQEFSVHTRGRGLYEFTDEVVRWVRGTGIGEGLLTLHVRHTSASLVIQENADPEVQRDLERFFTRLVPPGDPIFRHTSEGPDDMPAHVRSALTATTPVHSGQRRRPRARHLAGHLPVRAPRRGAPPSHRRPPVWASRSPALPRSVAPAA